MSTFKHDRKVRMARREARASAEREQERADLTRRVKHDALQMAVTDTAIKSRLKLSDISDAVFDELPVAERISILEDYIAKMRELRSQLLEKYSGNGKEANEEINHIQDLIDGATGMIIHMSIREVHEAFIPDPEEYGPATNTAGTSRGY